MGRVCVTFLSLGFLFRLVAGSLIPDQIAHLLFPAEMYVIFILAASFCRPGTRIEILR